MARNRSEEVNSVAFDSNLRPFLSLLSSYLHAKQNTSISWEPSFKGPSRYINRQRATENSVSFTTEALENMVLYLCVCDDPAHVQIFFDAMSDAGIAPTPRMREMIDSHINEKER